MTNDSNQKAPLQTHVAYGHVHQTNTHVQGGMLFSMVLRPVTPLYTHAQKPMSQNNLPMGTTTKHVYSLWAATMTAVCRLAQ